MSLGLNDKDTACILWEIYSQSRLIKLENVYLRKLCLISKVVKASVD